MGSTCSCGASVPLPDDPTERFATCPTCGARVDLREATSDATRVADAAALADPLLGRTVGDGRYRIDSLLGQGGMGRVYLGTQVQLNRRVAIKVLSADLLADEMFRRRFEREAATLAALDHPRIVSIYDVGVEAETPYIVMAYVAGPGGRPTSLGDLMAGQPLDDVGALGLIDQICSALEYAHERGVIHRDLKPGNVLIDEAGGARIVDFGIARASILGEQTLTVPGTFMGSLRYMSPEQKVDASAVDARSDLYSLGVVLYEMVTGQVPEGRFELPSRVRAGLDPRLDTIVDRALQVSAENRYQSAAEMRHEVTTITLHREYERRGGETAGPASPTPAARPAPPSPLPSSPASPPPVGTRPPRRGGRAKIGIVVGAILALVALVVIVALTSSGDGDGDLAEIGSVTEPIQAARIVFQALRENDPSVCDVLLASDDGRDLEEYMRITGGGDEDFHVRKFEGSRQEFLKDFRKARAKADGLPGNPIDWSGAEFAGITKPVELDRNNGIEGWDDVEFAISIAGRRHLFELDWCVEVRGRYVCVEGLRYRGVR